MQETWKFASADHTYSADDIAQAAGVPVRNIARRLRSEHGARRGVVTQADAVRLVREFAEAHDSRTVASNAVVLGFLANRKRRTTAGLATSGVLHAMLLCAFLLAAWLGRVDASSNETPDYKPERLVFLMTPGLGGGGGGGGVRIPLPPRRAERKAVVKRAVSSPVPAVRREVPPPEPVPPAPRPVEPIIAPPKPDPPPPPAPPAPAVNAPVVPMPADQKDVAGASSTKPPSTTQGAGDGGGAGSGAGRGVGKGDGSGIGAGSGGGTGGGPYRAGSGVEPPRLLREVKATYTDEARRQGTQGEVTLEIVVRRDGSVGDVRVLRGLGNGLDRMAIDAVRQWQFAPAHRLGSPVDVIVEVGVQFKLR